MLQRCTLYRLVRKRRGLPKPTSATGSPNAGIAKSWLLRQSQRPARNNDAGIRPNQILDRKNIRAALDASLKRLQTDYLDLYQVHWPQRPPTALESWAIAGMRAPRPLRYWKRWKPAECQRAGKIRYIGVSNETAFGVMRYLHRRTNMTCPASSPSRTHTACSTAAMKWVWPK